MRTGGGQQIGTAEGPTVLAALTVPPARQRAGRLQVAVGEHDGAGSRVSLDPHVVQREHVRPVEVRRHAAVALRLHLCAENPGRLVQALQLQVLAGVDRHDGAESTRRGQRRAEDAERLVRGVVRVLAAAERTAIDGDCEELQILAVQHEVGRLAGGQCALKAERRVDRRRGLATRSARRRLIELDHQRHAFHGVRRRRVVRAADLLERAASLGGGAAAVEVIRGAKRGACRGDGEQPTHFWARDYDTI
eukprot:3088173-Prymnesium_polylepis.1